MSQSEIEISLTQKIIARGGHGDGPAVRKFPPPLKNPERDNELVSQFEDLMSQAGFSANHDLVLNPDKPHQLNRRSGSLSPEWTEVALHIWTYRTEIAALAGGAFWVSQMGRNVLAIAKDWKDLTKGRSVSIKVRGQKILIEDGTDFEEVVRAIDEKLQSPDP